MSTRSYEGITAAGMALALGVAFALVIDLAAPRGDGGKAATTAPSFANAEGLAGQMEAQIQAGAPGVALALEQAAPIEARRGAAVAAARAHAQFELGDAPAALETAHVALRICEVTGGCSYGEKASLTRLDTVIGAVVAAGVVDPKRNPNQVVEAVGKLIRPAQLAPSKP